MSNYNCNNSTQEYNMLLIYTTKNTKNNKIKDNDQNNKIFKWYKKIMIKWKNKL